MTRDVGHHLTLTHASEAQARASASVQDVQDVHGTVRALLAASRTARKAAASTPA